MSRVWVTSDWHLGHAKLAKRRNEEAPWINEDNHEEAILDRYCQVVGKNDIVWFLGDVFWGTRWVKDFSLLPGKKRLVLGNHDTEKSSPPFSLFTEMFEQIHGLHKCRYAWLSHSPIHPDNLRGKYNIHGHTHLYSVDDPRYINVCLEKTDFYPVEYQSLWKSRSYPPLFNRSNATT